MRLPATQTNTYARTVLCAARVPAVHQVLVGFVLEGGRVTFATLMGMIAISGRTVLFPIMSGTTPTVRVPAVPQDRSPPDLTKETLKDLYGKMLMVMG